MPDIQIVFKTSAELAGAKALLESLEKELGAAKMLGKDYTELEKTAAKARAAIAASDKPSWIDQAKESLGGLVPGFEKFSGIIGKLATGPLGLAAAGFAALAGAVELAKK